MTRGRTPDEAQYALDFASRHAEGTRLLRAALARCCPSKDRAKHWLLLEAIHAATDGVAHRTNEELAAVLWCSERSVRRVVEELHSWSLLVVLESRDKKGFRSTNRYQIDWSGVRLASFRQATTPAAGREQVADDHDGDGGTRGQPGLTVRTAWPHGEDSLSSSQGGTRGQPGLTVEDGEEQDRVRPTWPHGEANLASQLGRKEGRKDLLSSEQATKNPSFLPSSSSEARADFEARVAAPVDFETCATGATGWGEAEGALLEAGVGGARRAVRSAREHGWHPPAVFRAIAVYQENRHRWPGANPGVLYYRVLNGPGEKFDDWTTWAKPSAEPEKESRRAADRAQAEADRRAAEAERADLAAATAACGEAFKALAEVDLLALARRCGVTPCAHLRKVRRTELLLALWRESQGAVAS